jgi:cellulose synthase/poly-beta-1,6-N-acetylglucosamine synthase-like glycosyltransferase
MPRVNEIKAESFKPSSRNISFSRSAWQDAGRYPENMDFGEDMKFNFNILNAGYEIKFNPEAEVYWDMRDSLTAVFKQFFRYAKGDAIGKMYPRRHLIRILSLLLFLGILIVSIVFSPFFLLALLPLLAFYICKPYCRIYYYLNNKNKYIFNKNRLNCIISFLGSILVIPLIMIIIDTAKLFGYTYGLFAENRH